MIKVKHVLDRIEPDDGLRMWVEPIGLTKDLQQWCRVDHVLPQLGPPKNVSEQFERCHSYALFREGYHAFLCKSGYVPALERLAREGKRHNFTLLHASDDGEHNCATALRDFINGLEASRPQEQA